MGVAQQRGMSFINPRIFAFGVLAAVVAAVAAALLTARQDAHVTDHFKAEISSANYAGGAAALTVVQQAGVSFLAAGAVLAAVGANADTAPLFLQTVSATGISDGTAAILATQNLARSVLGIELQPSHVEDFALAYASLPAELGFDPATVLGHGTNAQQALVRLVDGVRISMATVGEAVADMNGAAQKLEDAAGAPGAARAGELYEELDQLEEMALGLAYPEGQTPEAIEAYRQAAEALFGKASAEYAALEEALKKATELLQQRDQILADAALSDQERAQRMKDLEAQVGRLITYRGEKNTQAASDAAARLQGAAGNQTFTGVDGTVGHVQEGAANARRSQYGSVAGAAQQHIQAAGTLAGQ